jgi:cellobiose-specific phosphotransferase system component IIB
MNTVEQPKVPIEALPVQKSHIDLSSGGLPTDFGLEDYLLSSLMDDVMLLEFCDLAASVDGQDFVQRGAIFIPTAQVNNMWRKGRVILKGPNVRFTQVGDIVMFPSNMGIQITNVEVENHGKVNKGIFLNEQRMFGICKPKNS